MTRQIFHNISLQILPHLKHAVKYMAPSLSHPVPSSSVQSLALSFFSATIFMKQVKPNTENFLKRWLQSTKH